ncbi:uncharacterized protein LOC131687423 [Topomyia yanbarensis]|uniref:uncharacterized protein LOC131687423 n=1 Tax=Topomyia yanbarensis TaxID=2498891 RepID=UPI00273B513D|nr:uncharacterized protein LOC131687423 [Topomyia yanbarensis]
MASNGKYVLAKNESEPHSNDVELEQEASSCSVVGNNNDDCDECSKRSNSESYCSSECESQNSEDSESIKDRNSITSSGSVRSLCEARSPNLPQNSKGTTDTNPEIQVSTNTKPVDEANCGSDRMQRIEQVLADLTKAISRFESGTQQPANHDAEQSWNFSHDPSKPQCSYSNSVNALTLDDALINCSIGESSPICFLIDSGSDVNVIGGKDWLYLERELKAGIAKFEIIQRLTPGLHAYASAKPMAIKCTFKGNVVVLGSTKPSVVATFHVVSDGARSLLGRSTANDLKLLQVGKSVNTFETLDEDLFPKMPGVKVKFSVDNSVAPTKNAYYNVPAAFREAARLRLHDMEKRGIIEKVTSAPSWISGMSAVAKGKSDFRLVVNMRAPNKAINREYFRLPLIEEMRVKLHGSKYFSKLDLSSAFYHLELAEESRELTTFLAENGMYRFTRLMFGVNCAPEIF